MVVLVIILRNRRATSRRSHLALIPLEKLFAHPDDILVYTPRSSSDYAQADDPFEQVLENPVVISFSQRHSRSDMLQWKIPRAEWPNAIRRVVENHEPLRKVAGDYGVSYETIRRMIGQWRKHNALP